MFADGLTRWSQVELDEWVSSEDMVEVDAVSRLWANMSLSYNPDSEATPPPTTFAISVHVLHFLRSYNYRVCECRPSHFAVAGVMGRWDVPVFSDQVLDAAIHDLLVSRASHPMELIGDIDIFLLIGFCASLSEILDFRRTVSQRSARYAAMIVPFWMRDGAESALWTSQTIIDTTLTGDPWASGWMVYCAGGITSHQFDISPVNAEIRTLGDCYRLVGQECEEDLDGVRAIHTIPNSVGKVTAIATEWVAQYSRHSRIPSFAIDSLYGNSISWPLRVSTGLQTTPPEKIAVLGGHIGLLDGEITLDQCERMTPRVYPCGIVRRILRGDQNRFQSNLPSESIRGRAGGPSIVSGTHEFFPRMMGRVMGQDRMAAVLSGAAPGTRKRYLTAWRHSEQFMKDRHLPPWIWRVSPDWGDHLIDFVMLESKIFPNAPNTISGKISGIRRWHLLEGMPDFALCGGRYRQVLKCVRRNSRVNRQGPVALEILADLSSQQHPDDHQSTGIACAAIVGFFYLLRVGELENLRRTDASLSTDQDGGACLQLTLPRSKTDQYSEGHVKVIKGSSHPLCPVRAMGRWMGIQPDGKVEGDDPVCLTAIFENRCPML